MGLSGNATILWAMMKMNSKIWDRLLQGSPLHALGVDRKEGRFDLRNLHVAEARATQTNRTRVGDTTILEGTTEIRGMNWQSIDFSSSQLPTLRFFDCKISDCVFDECTLRDLRVWGTAFTDVSFRSANLRGAVLGGVQDSKRNIFKNVDFSSADLRKTVYVAAEFLGCQFKDSKLDNVDFQSSTFEDCSFEGELREVIFYSKGFKGDNFPRNKMKGVDFSRARLRWTEFRGLDLDDVRFPVDEEHILIKNFPASLERLTKFFQARSDTGSKRLAAVLANKRKWLGPAQNVGLFNKTDLLEIAGKDGLRSFLDMVEIIPPSQDSSAG
jgi:uncharacterized protein YjbI with pentapeptide repeats